MADVIRSLMICLLVTVIATVLIAGLGGLVVAIWLSFAIEWATLMAWWPWVAGGFATLVFIWMLTTAAKEDWVLV